MEPKIIRQPNGKDLIHAQRGWVYHVYEQSGKALVGLSLGPGPHQYAAYSVHSSGIADLEEFKADLDRLGWKYKKVIKAGPDLEKRPVSYWLGEMKYRPQYVPQDIQDLLRKEGLI